MLTASWDNTARLWEAESGKQLPGFQGHTDKFTTAVFSPDGRRVLITGNSTHGSASYYQQVLLHQTGAHFPVWLGGKRIAPDGQIEMLSADEFLKLNAQLRPHINADSDYARLLPSTLMISTPGTRW